MRRCDTFWGYTLIEMLITVAVLAIVAGFTFPSVSKALLKAKASMETKNLQIIEMAKNAFEADNPGVKLQGFSDLAPYLPDNQLPVSPWGTDYAGWDSLDQITRSLVNGNPEFEPDILPLEANGYNDLSVPGYVTLVRLTPEGFAGFPTVEQYSMLAPLPSQTPTPTPDPNNPLSSP